jgi:hypothetical protein
MPFGVLAYEDLSGKESILFKPLKEFCINAR